MQGNNGSNRVVSHWNRSVRLRWLGTAAWCELDVAPLCFIGVRSFSENPDIVQVVDQIAGIKFMGIIADRVCNECHVLNEGDNITARTAFAWIARQGRSGVALLTQREPMRRMWHICLTQSSSRNLRNLPHSGRIPAFMLKLSRGQSRWGRCFFY